MTSASESERSTPAVRPAAAGRTPGRRKPRLLLLAHYFPPVNTIGAVRAFEIAKWLTRKGWEVTVVTPRSTVWSRAESADDVYGILSREGIRCMRTEYPAASLSSTGVNTEGSGLGRYGSRIARRLVRAVGIDGEIGWLIKAEQSCAALSPEDVDLVLATGPPFGAFRLASRVARRLGRPLVLDYRDLWTGNPHSNRGRSRRSERIEARYLQQASVVTVVSPSLGQSIDAHFDVGSKVHVVSNGYDSEDLAEIAPQEFGHFAIVYAGTFYPPKRVIGPVVAALRQLKTEGRVSPTSWKFHYYGAQVEHVRQAVVASDLHDNVVIHGQVSRKEVLAAVRGAGVAVVITSVQEEGTLEDRSIVTGKIFEALGLRTPSLIIAPRGSDLEGIVRITGLGRRFSGSEIGGMVSFLEGAIAGKNPEGGNAAPFDWRQIGDRLNELLIPISGLSTGVASSSASSSPAENLDAV